MNLTYAFGGAIFMKRRFRRAKLLAITNQFYNVSIIKKEKERWVQRDMCAICRRKTKFQLQIEKWIDMGLWKSKYVWCCGPECMDKELEILQLEVLEAITR